MLSLHVSVPIACFRKSAAREYLETEPLPPPATCYGMLLSLVGETDRLRHVGARITAGLLGETKTSAVLRTRWRVKNTGTRDYPVNQGQNPLPWYPKNIKDKGGNVSPDYQELLTGVSPERPFVDLVLHLDSGEERSHGATLEERVLIALDPARRHEIHRWGGLSLGESTHMIDSISVLNAQRMPETSHGAQRTFLKDDDGSISLPVWVDHVGSAKTRYIVGDFCRIESLSPPRVDQIPKIEPP